MNEYLILLDEVTDAIVACDCCNPNSCRMACHYYNDEINRYHDWYKKAQYIVPSRKGVAWEDK